MGSASFVDGGPAHRVLRRAEATHRAVGHENLGFLSEDRGFMPSVLPLERLPAEFAAWDEAAYELPKLYGSLRLRRHLDRLPNLRTELDGLPDHALLRACNVLAILAHAYQYVETRPPDTLPEAITEPWAEVRRRLGRPDPVLSYIDLIVYNFRLVDPRHRDPFRVENMRLLTPTVDTAEERVFYLTQAEILGQTAPIVASVARAQDAVLADDPQTLARELRVVIERLQHVVRVSLLKIDPNPAGPTFVNPVVWAKTVAPFAVPIPKGVQGPSGTSSPLFNLLDQFFGRTQHASFLGREIRDLRRTYPKFWQEFLVAVGAVSTAGYVARKRCSELSGLWMEAVDAYVGSGGFLGRHRLKVYGYLELAFKVGRSVTIGGFSGMFKDRTWDQVDSELEYSRRERLESFPEACHLATLYPAPDGQWADAESARRVRLGVHGAGLRYEPGDRCGILAENGEDLVSRTLSALEATGDECIELTSEWREHCKLRPGHAAAKTLTLRDLLRFGRIRPVIPRVAEALHAVTQYPALRAAILDQTTTRWELWELLLDLRENGHDVRRLWQAAVTSSGYISRVVPPENFRMYSISSVMAPEEKSASEVELTVGLVRYRTPSSTRSPDSVRRGTASNFLADGSGHGAVPFIVQHPPRFGLPQDPSVPIVMIAGGTGVSPFLSFIRKRSHLPSAGEAWLYWGLRTRADFVYREELAAAVASGRLHVEIAFSRERVAASFVPDGRGGGRFDFVPAPSCYADELLLEERNQSILLELVESRTSGGRGAHVYVCGRSRFARSVDKAFRRIYARAVFAGREKSVDAIEARLAGEGRFLREIYTDPRSSEEEEPRFDVSDVITRNDPAAGYWFVLDGRVYDLSSFLHVHPGGMHVLRGYAGMDATQGYLRAHARATEVDAVRDMYAIGKVRVLEFRDESRVVERDQVTHRTSVASLHRAWVAFSYLAVEMQNALRGDFSLKTTVTARDEDVSPTSPYKLERLIETQERFLKSYTTVLSGAPAIQLWELLEGLFRGRPSSFMKDALTSVLRSSASRYVHAATAELRVDLRMLVNGSVPTAEGARLSTACELLEASASRFLEQVKALLRDGLLLFERHQADVLEKAGTELLHVLGSLPDVLSAYLAHVEERLRRLGYEPWVAPETIPPQSDEERGPKVLTFNRYWLMEYDARRAVVFLRRSAAPLQSIEDLVEQNERIIEKIWETRTCRGVVVDTRQAPPRNDREFEEAMRRMRNQVCRTYPRVAVLLASAAGVLQVTRLGRDDDAPTLVTQSEEAAIQFAMGQA